MVQHMDEKAQGSVSVKKPEHKNDEIRLPWSILQEGLALYAEKSLANGDSAPQWGPGDMEEYRRVLLSVQDLMEQKLRDPAKHQALELARESQDLFWNKQYEKSIQRISEAADLDPDYAYRVEALAKAIQQEMRKGPVRLTRAINRILYPRLRKLGFRPKFGDDNEKWTEQTSHLIRINPQGREGGTDFGRTKFGRRFALAVFRHNSSGEREGLDLGKFGLDDEALRYLNQEEADEMLDRVAKAFEGPIVAWLDEEL